MRTFVAIVLASLAPRLKCDTCQGFSVPFCATAGYNMTKLPNRFGHSESQIQTKLKALKPLGMTDCHKDLRQFVCLFYMPFCGYGRNPLLPCRQQCEQIQSQCRKQIEYFKFGWLLNEINCQDLPSYSSDEMKCAGYAGEGGTSLSESLAPADTSQIQCTQPEKMECPAELEMLAGDSPSKYNFLGLANCGPPCTDHFWTEAEIKLSRKWILGWGVLCLISTLFTVCTYLIDRERFRYPERPIVFLAACYLIVSVVYITGFFMDFDVSCTRNNKDLENPFFSQNPTLVVIQGTKNQACTVLFMILYFSTMASSIWWLVLCVNWFLAAVLKWSGEAIENQSQYFHLVAWAVPAITTVSVLALGRIEGDPLSGICSVGQYDTQSLQIFLLWPQLVLLSVGFIFLIVGFLSMYRIRAVVKTKDPMLKAHEGLEKLMLKIGIFSSLYLIPASILLGCYFYTYMYNVQWNETWLHDHCYYRNQNGPKFGFNCPCGLDEKIAQNGKRRPNFTFFMLRYFMMLIVGVTCGFWIWSDKTVKSWQKFFLMLSCRKPKSDGQNVPLRNSHRMEPAYPVLPSRPGHPADPAANGYQMGHPSQGQQRFY